MHRISETEDFHAPHRTATSPRRADRHRPCAEAEAHTAPRRIDVAVVVAEQALPVPVTGPEDLDQCHELEELFDQVRKRSRFRELLARCYPRLGRAAPSGFTEVSDGPPDLRPRTVEPRYGISRLRGKVVPTIQEGIVSALPRTFWPDTVVLQRRERR